MLCQICRAFRSRPQYIPYQTVLVRIFSVQTAFGGYVVVVLMSGSNIRPFWASRDFWHKVHEQYHRLENDLEDEWMGGKSSQSHPNVPRGDRTASGRTTDKRDIFENRCFTLNVINHDQ